MPAPKGNRYWEARSSHGRSPKFETSEQLWSAAVEYFEWVANNPLEEAIVYQGALNEEQSKPLLRAMTLDGLLLFIGISDTTWGNYKDRGEDFLGVIKEILRVIRTQKFEGASAGLLNPNIIARDLGLVDKKEHTGKDGGPIDIKHDANSIARKIAFALQEGLDASE